MILALCSCEKESDDLTFQNCGTVTAYTDTVTRNLNGAPLVFVRMEVQSYKTGRKVDGFWATMDRYPIGAEYCNQDLNK